MDREELNEWIRSVPIRITMNSGDTIDLTNRELVTVSSVAAVVLVRCDDGKYRHRVYPLVTMSKIEQLEPTSRSSCNSGIA
ncbi:MAG: hypothetical protein AAF802_07360 [Planctomycetota bacterium]